MAGLRKSTQPEQLVEAEKPLPSESMLPLRIGFFAYYGCTGFRIYLLPLFLKQMGFTPLQIGINTCVCTLGALFGLTLLSVWRQSVSRLKYLMLIIWALNLVLIMPFTMIRPSTTNHCVPNLTTDNDFSDRSWMFQEGDVVVIFVIMNGLLFCAEGLSIMIITILQGGCMLALQRGKQNTGSYAYTRAWGSMAQFITFLSLGFVAPETRRKVCGSLLVAADYHFIFYIYSCFLLIGLLSSRYSPLVTQRDDVAETVTDSTTETRPGLRTAKTVIWLIVQFCWSMFFSVTHGFLNWHIENLGATPFLIGLMNALAIFAQLIGFLLAPKLIQCFGHSKIIGFGVLAQIGRFVAFSLLSKPASIIPLLAVEGIMFASMWSSSASYLTNQVSGERQTEVHGLLQTVHTTGKAAGFLLGGCLTQAIGATGMFLVFAGAACLTLALFAAAHCKQQIS